MDILIIPNKKIMLKYKRESLESINNYCGRVGQLMIVKY